MDGLESKEALRWNRILPSSNPLDTLAKAKMQVHITTYQLNIPLGESRIACFVSAMRPMMSD